MGADLRGAWSSRAATSQDLAGDRVHDNPADRRIGGVRRLDRVELEHEPADVGHRPKAVTGLEGRELRGVVRLTVARGRVAYIAD